MFFEAKFSKTTVPASTTIPIPTEIPDRDIIFIVVPNKRNIIIEKKADIGITEESKIATLVLCKKHRITIAVTNIPAPAEHKRLIKASRTSSDKSSITTKE